MVTRLHNCFLSLGLCLLAVGHLGCATTGSDTPGLSVAAGANEPASSIIVQGQGLETVKRLVVEVGGARKVPLRAGLGATGRGLVMEAG